MPIKLSPSLCLSDHNKKSTAFTFLTCSCLLALRALLWGTAGTWGDRVWWNTAEAVQRYRKSFNCNLKSDNRPEISRKGFIVFDNIEHQNIWQCTPLSLCHHWSATLKRYGCVNTTSFYKTQTGAQEQWFIPGDLLSWAVHPLMIWLFIFSCSLTMTLLFLGLHSPQ